MLADRFVDLIAEGFDAAVRVGPLSDSSLVGRRIGQGRLWLVASPGWIAAHGRPGPDALADDVCITQNPAERWSLDGKTIRLRPRLVVNDIDAACAAAVAGLGVARVPSFVAERWIEAGALERLHESELAPPLYVVMPSRAYVPAKVRVFVELVAAQTERVFGAAPTRITARRSPRRSAADRRAS